MSYNKAQRLTLHPVLVAAWILLAVIDHSGIITLLPCTAPQPSVKTPSLPFL